LRTKVKHSCFLILIQVACVAVGLWMQHQYVVSALETQLEEQTLSRLERSLQALAGRAAGLPPGELPQRLQDLAAGTALLNGPDVLLTDAEGRVISATEDEASAHSSRPVAGQVVTFSLTAGADPAAPGPIRGTLDLPDGKHLAVRQALAGDGRGYLLAHWPRAALRAELDALSGSLPAVGAVALFWTCALLTIAVFVLMGRVHDSAERQRERSTAHVMRQAQNLVRTRDAVIFGLAKLADSRHGETGAHLERISAYATALANAARRHPKFASRVTPAFVRLIGISSALHDIGKVGIEDRILLKRGAFTCEERGRMEAHTLVAGECLREIEQRLGSSNFLQMARAIAMSHHERWDGKGYPQGLSGTAIPLAARLTSIADVYDALRTPRVYKPAFPHEECVSIIREEAGRRFDPDLVDVFLTIEGTFRDIADRYRASAEACAPATAAEFEPAGVEEGLTSAEAHAQASPDGTRVLSALE